jgi:hypothetical protein
MKGHRTIIWNAANAVVVAMQAADASYKIPDEWIPYWLGAYVVGNIVLRLVTTTPVGHKA